MITTDDINKYKSLPNNQKQALEKQWQQDELNYLSSVAFEKFTVSSREIDAINTLITKKIKPTSTSFNTIFISALCGLLIGITLFFVVFEKSKTHPSVAQQVDEEQTTMASLNNNTLATDTVFPELIQPITNKSTEHFNTPANTQIEMGEAELLETISTKSMSLNELEPEQNDDLILQFAPNAPVVFMSNMKITNYDLYYFKHHEGINLSVNTGVSAQYENKNNIEQTAYVKNSAYYAHKMIQRAMRLFNNKNYSSCMEELTLLYDFNKEDANAQFYLGMCYYQLNKFALAQTYFSKNLDNSNNIFHQESEYYEALCLLKTNQEELAKIMLQKIIAKKGFYGARAKEVLEK